MVRIHAFINCNLPVIDLFLLGEQVITRDCLSSLQSFRTDIPADHYEGCRPAARDVKLANYVNNSIKELDVYRFVHIIHFNILLLLMNLFLEIIMTAQHGAFVFWIIDAIMHIYRHLPYYCWDHR